MRDFVHLHVHTQYSILDGASDISALLKKAKADGMKALAITDHGNMFGAKVFHNYAKKEGIKPIIGCEAYVTKGKYNSRTETLDKERDHLIILAKNEKGYYNLVKLISLSWIDGFYSKPRIDKDLLFENSEGLIISTACIGGIVPKYIIKDNLEAATQTIKEYKEHTLNLTK